MSFLCSDLRWLQYAIWTASLSSFFPHHIDEFFLIEQYWRAHISPFLAETLWLTVDPTVTFADLAGNLFEALDKPLPDLSNLAPQNQALALFNALNTANKPRLVILDAFENLLDWDTGHALTDRPGVGEWLDILNSQQCLCRVLFTSRPRPIGTREYPPTYLQEYSVDGLEVDEGIALLQNQGVQDTEAELQIAVTKCAGHAFSLTLLAALLRNHHMSLPTLFKNSVLWKGDIATNLLDQIYTQRLSEVQRGLLLAFSVYREPVSLDAALATMDGPLHAQAPLALKSLLTQHLLEAVGEGRYRLHAIVADYAQSRFHEGSERTNEETLRAAHARAAQYYLQLAAVTCPPQERRRRVNDVHNLIEAVWQYCKAGQRLEAYDLLRQERILPDLRLWGGNIIVLGLCELLLEDHWEMESLQAALIYSNLGLVYRVLGRKEKALKYHKQALNICQELGDRQGEGITLNNLGEVYADLGILEKAMEHSKQALHIFREIKDLEGEATSLNDLGSIYRALGQMTQALESHQQALSIYRALRDRKGEGMALNELGLVYNKLGKKELAQEYFRQALTIRREVGHRQGEAGTLNNLGIVYSDLGEKKQALDCYQQSLRIRKEVGDRSGEGKTLYNIGKLYFNQECFNIVLACFLLARKIFEDVQIPDRNAAQGWIDTIHKAIGDEQFTDLLVTVEPQVQQIVDQVLQEEMN